jgi:hypothetical protein
MGAYPQRVPFPNLICTTTKGCNSDEHLRETGRCSTGPPAGSLCATDATEEQQLPGFNFSLALPALWEDRDPDLDACLLVLRLRRGMPEVLTISIIDKSEFVVDYLQTDVDLYRVWCTKVPTASFGDWSA